MPLLWFTGPSDAHFPLAAQQLSYRAASGARMISVPLEMKHGHPPGWNPPDSYAFAQAVVATGRPWAREIKAEIIDGVARVEFATARITKSATLIFKRDATWEKAPATLATAPGHVTASAPVPAGSSAYYFNLDADGPTLSSEFRTITP